MLGCSCSVCMCVCVCVWRRMPPNKTKVNVRCLCSFVDGPGCPIGPQAAPLGNNKFNSHHMFFAPLCLAPVVRLVPKPPYLRETGATNPQATPPNKNKFNVRCLCCLVNGADYPIGPQAAAFTQLYLRFLV